MRIRSALRSFALCQSPPAVLNLTGPETVSVRWAARRFAERFGIEPILEGTEIGHCAVEQRRALPRLFGYPTVSVEQMIEWIADWIGMGGRDSRTSRHISSPRRQILMAWRETLRRRRRDSGASAGVDRRAQTGRAPAARAHAILPGCRARAASRWACTRRSSRSATVGLYRAGARARRARRCADTERHQSRRVWSARRAQAVREAEFAAGLRLRCGAAEPGRAARRPVPELH